MVLTYHEAVAAGARALVQRAVAEQARAGDATDAEWDEMLAVSHLIGDKVLRIDGPSEVIAAAVLSAVGYADLLAEVENLRITVREDKRVMDRDAVEIERLRRVLLTTERDRDEARQGNGGAARLLLDNRSLRTQRDALAATLARVKVEGDRWANSKNYTVQFAGGLLRNALRPPAADDE